LIFSFYAIMYLTQLKIREAALSNSFAGSPPAIISLNKQPLYLL
jgi:hypothetical protein